MMKNSLLLTVALPALLFVPMLAQADSSTLYGVFDTGLGYVNNAGGHALAGTSSSNLSGGRWGLKGVESISSDVRVIYTLENGFSPNTGALGQAGRMFGRQSFVGIQTDDYGTLQVGRQYTPMELAIGPQTAGLRWATWYYTHPFDADMLGGITHDNNALNYRSPSLYGLVATVQYAFSNASGTMGNNSAWGGALEYARGPLTLAAGYHNFENPNGSSNTSGAVSGDYQSALGVWIKQLDYNISGRTSSASLSVGRQTVWGASATYKLEKWDLTGIWSSTTLSGLGITSANSASMSATNGQLRMDSYEASVTYHLSPSWQAGISYTFTKGNFVTALAQRDLDWHAAAIGTDYALSKTTDIYGSLVLDIATGKDNVAQASLGAASSNQRQFASIFGIRHRF